MTKGLFKTKPLMILALALVMVFCLSFGAFAAEYPASYVQDGSHATSDAINVTVTVEGVDIPYTEVPVSLNAKSSGTQKVLDAMLAINSAGGNIYFWESEDVFIDANSTYFTYVNSETGTGAGYSGWCFRVNGGFPMESAGWGATIASATIKNGDVVSFFIDDPSASSAAAKFTRTNASYANGTVTATVTESHQYFQGSNWDWIITDYAALSGVTVQVLNGASVVASGITGSDGTVSVSTGSLAAGAYTVKAVGTKNASGIITTTSTTTFTVE